MPCLGASYQYLQHKFYGEIQLSQNYHQILFLNKSSVLWLVFTWYVLFQKKKKDVKIIWWVKYHFICCSKVNCTILQVKFYFHYPTEEVKPVIKSSQTTPSFKTNVNQNNNISKATISMDSLRVDHVDSPHTSNSLHVGHNTRSRHSTPQSLQDPSVDIRHTSSSSRHNRLLKVSPSGDRKGLLVSNPSGSGSGEQISDSLSTASDEDFSDTDTDDEWEGCDVTEVWFHIYQ